MDEERGGGVDRLIAVKRAGKPARAVKPKAPLCNCRATMELYGKAWPHRAGAVKGCHMGADGQAKDGLASPGCQCRACESTNTNGREDSPFWNAGMSQDIGHPIGELPWPRWMGKDLETAWANWQAHGAGVP